MRLDCLGRGTGLKQLLKGRDGRHGAGHHKFATLGPAQEELAFAGFTEGSCAGPFDVFELPMVFFWRDFLDLQARCGVVWR